jgi:hypothetical protein
MQVRRRRWIILGSLLLGVAIGRLLLSQTSSSSQPQTKMSPTQLFMRLKMEPAKLILEGIATENYDLIASSAQQVQLLTLDEKWNVMQTEEYLRDSDEFQRSVQLVRDNAKNRNLDGATLAYMQMTLNCIKCHRDMRTP